MFGYLIDHFEHGDLDHHKAASKQWVLDVAPAVETQIGFIESYRDPLGIRAEFEGFVAMVDKPMSTKFAALVAQAQELLPLLPWPATFEKDVFVKPEFMSLTVLAFASSGLPLGICLPNYDDVKRAVGFKNVDLANVASARGTDERVEFIPDADQELYQRLYVRSDTVLTGLHELLGHGSGKLFQEAPDGTLNFSSSVTNPLNGGAIKTWYKPGQSYGGVFGDIASSMEECRAECVSLVLSDAPGVQRLFGFEGKDAADSVYLAWLGMCQMGLKALEVYDPVQRRWGDAHSRARFAILRTCIEAGIATINTNDDAEGAPNAVIQLDRSRIATEGVAAISALLLRIMVYRSTADAAAAQVWYNERTAVDEFFNSLREIVMARRRPRKVLCNRTLS